jgi:prepilin-type N-terminal cleavage/methylation domain-containing protein
MFKNKKGFTLIELMVVIAIIAILATVVLVALQGARDAATDSKVSAIVAQGRSIAEIRYAVNDQSYTGFNATADWTHLASDTEVTLTSYASADGKKYCVSAPLTGTNNWFCVSNASPPKKYTGVTATCNDTNHTCVSP